MVEIPGPHNFYDTKQHLPFGVTCGDSVPVEIPYSKLC